jgi:alkanesulfonate monooxygenase SsuD/methylene tetrahydromethanopterin reductase-like flavin-dependent oxidoreductase (luciferase family)
LPTPRISSSASTSPLRVVAEHADLWNVPGGDIDDAVRRSARLDELCVEIGRDPASITRSIHLPVSYGEAGRTRDAIAEAVEAGFGHVILGLSPPYPEQVAAWVAAELIPPSRG